MSVLPIAETTPLVIARDRGYFKEEGIEIEVNSTPGGALGISGLVANGYDIVLANTVSVILAWNQGIDVKVLAANTKITGNPPTTQMVGLSGQSYDGAHLAGKRIAVNTRSSVIWLYARAWANARGADADKLSYREVPFPQMEDALMRGQVDAALMAQPYKSIAAKNPKLAVVGDPFAEVQPGADAGYYVVSGKFAAANVQTLRKFARALRRGADWFNAHLTDPSALKATAEITKLDISLLREIGLKPQPTVVDLSQLARTATLMREHGLLNTVPPMAQHILPEALQRE